MLLQFSDVNTVDKCFSCTCKEWFHLHRLSTKIWKEKSNYISASIFLLALSDNSGCVTVGFCKTNQRDVSVRTENGRRKSALKSTCTSSLHCQLWAHFEIKEQSYKIRSNQMHCYKETSHQLFFLAWRSKNPDMLRWRLQAN